MEKLTDHWEEICILGRKAFDLFVAVIVLSWLCAWLPRAPVLLRLLAQFNAGMGP